MAKLRSAFVVNLADKFAQASAAVLGYRIRWGKLKKTCAKVFNSYGFLALR